MDWGNSHDRNIELSGYTLLPAPIRADLIAKAKELIEDDFAANMPRSPEDWDRCGRDTFCQALIEKNRLDFLAFASGSFAFADQATGNLSKSMNVQVARRRHGDAGGPHIDGFNLEINDDVDTPDAILGIYLTAVLNCQDGAFTVWPEARHQVVEWSAGLTSLPRVSDGAPEFDEPGSGTPVLGKKGTAFLVHGCVPHCNVNRVTRTGYRDAVFFRLYRDDPHRNVVALLKSGGVRW